MRQNTALLLLYLFLGIADCITTVFGYIFLEVNELNGLMLSLLNMSIWVFLCVKIGLNLFAVFSLDFGEKLILQFKDNAHQAKILNYVYKGALYGLLLFMGWIVVNNLVIIALTVWA